MIFSKNRSLKMRNLCVKDDIGSFSLLDSLTSVFGDFSKGIRLPKDLNSKVQVDPILNEFLPRFDQPVIFQDDCTCYQKIVGYRELYIKNQRIFQLQLIADYYVYENDSKFSSFRNELAPGGGPRPVPPGKVQPKNETNVPAAPKKETKSLAKTVGAKIKNVKSAAQTVVGSVSRARTVAPSMIHAPVRRHENSDFPVVEQWRDKCERQLEEISEPEPDYQEVDAVRQERQKTMDEGKPVIRQMSLGSHYMFLYRGRQMDSEWFQLSASSDPEIDDVERDRRSRLMPTLEDWMDPGLNYGSQKLMRALTCFVTLLTLTWRNPFVFQPCYRNKIIMVHVFRKRMFLYSFSTLFLWMVLCFIITNIIDLHYLTETTDAYKTMEKNEMDLYSIPLLGFLINLILAALWSLLMLLNYSLVLANYFNLWSKAMPLLDLNPSYNLARYTRIHLWCYALYVALFYLSFHYNWPLVTRETCGQIFVLTFRQMFPQVRLLDPDQFYWGQLGAFCVYMYCIWVNRTLYILMHTFSIVLRNACYQWNLNFALRFQLVPTYYRAHLMRIASQSSLLRLYNQHRLIAALCDYFGKAFVQPLFVYGALNIGVMTLIMIYFIRYEEKDPATFGYKFTFDLKEHLGSDSKAKIYHTLPKQDEVTAVFLVMVQCIVDFFQGTIGLGWGSAAISGSFEFVRRHGLLQCNTRHERRLIHSLYMSFADVRTPLMTAQRYFGITRRNVYIGITTMAFFWTMIIQCQVEQPSALIEWIPSDHRDCEGLRTYEDVLGGKYCMLGHKYRKRIKQRLLRNRNQHLKTRLNGTFDTKTKFWFFEECNIEEMIAQDNPTFEYKSFGICQVTFSSSKASEKWDSRYPRYITRYHYPQFEHRWNRSIQEWTPPQAGQYHTKSPYHPCDIDGGQFTWKDYYRDFFRPCWSKAFNTYVVLPVLFRKKGDHGVINVREDADCGINPFTQEDIKGVVGCSGKWTALDDCGSPRAPDFLINSNQGAGLFRHEPPLRYYSFPIELPPNYLQAGFPEAGVIRCWDTFIAKQKCVNETVRQYCRIAKSKGRTDLKGYLYGKDCWDFQNFAVFVEPNYYLFCLHPRAENDIEKPMWIDEQTYRKEMKTHPDPTSLGRAIGRRKPEKTTTETPTLPPEVDQIHLRGVKKAKGPSMGRAIPQRPVSLGRSALQSSMKGRSSARSAMYQEGNRMRRKDLFKNFFPCEDSKDRIIGWLPLPHVWFKGSKKSVLTEKELHKAREGSPCWDDPYPAKLFEPADKLIKVRDAYGRSFLDDCLTPWWESDVGIFIPDDVFDPPNIALVEQNGFKCWEKPDALHEKELFSEPSGATQYGPKNLRRMHKTDPSQKSSGSRTSRASRGDSISAHEPSKNGSGEPSSGSFQPSADVQSWEDEEQENSVPPVGAKRKSRCCGEDCKRNNSRWRISCYIVSGILLFFGFIRVGYNVCAILYFIVPLFPLEPFTFFGGIVDPVSAIFAIITRDSGSTFVMMLVVNLAAKFLFEMASGTVMLLGTVKKRRSFCLCFMRLIYISLFYTLAETVGYVIFFSKGFRLSNGLGIGQSDADIIYILFVVFHVLTVVGFRIFAFYSAHRYRKEIPRYARRINARYYWQPRHIGQRVEHNRRLLLIVE